VGAALRAVRASTVRVTRATLWDWLSLGCGRTGAFAACLVALCNLLSLFAED
jgi:hypothetical protein